MLSEFKLQLEQQEAACWKEYFMMAPRQSLEELDLGCKKIGKAVAVFASKLDILAFNRVIALGMELPVSPKQLDEIISLYRDAGTKTSWTTGLGVFPAGIGGIQLSWTINPCKWIPDKNIRG